VRQIKFLLFSISLIVSLAACGGGGGGASCNATTLCEEGQYCKYEVGLCGQDGECTEIPATCDAALVSAVCTCDGLSFFNDCFAAQAGQSIQSAGNCA